MPVTSINSVAASTGTTTAATSRLPVQTLDQDDFLKLLVAQLSAQDPMNPQKDTEFIAQMAQFSSLEQARATQSDISGLRADQQVVQANSMIGRTVTLQDAAGAVVTGVVSGLSLVSGTPQILVNGQAYALSSVRGVTVTPTSN
jgi:flagellar basal-body rod modification protein FlgD